MDSDLEKFILSKIADVKKSIVYREQASACFRSGTDETWKMAAELHPSTSGKPMKKNERRRAAESNERIAIKLRLELEMFNRVLAALQTQ